MARRRRHLEWLAHMHYLRDLQRTRARDARTGDGGMSEPADGDASTRPAPPSAARAPDCRRVLDPAVSARAHRRAVPRGLGDVRVPHDAEDLVQDDVRAGAASRPRMMRARQRARLPAARAAEHPREQLPDAVAPSGDRAAARRRPAAGKRTGAISAGELMEAVATAPRSKGRGDRGRRPRPLVPRGGEGLPDAGEDDRDPRPPRPGDHRRADRAARAGAGRRAELTARGPEARSTAQRSAHRRLQLRRGPLRGLGAAPARQLLPPPPLPAAHAARRLRTGTSRAGSFRIHVGRLLRAWKPDGGGEKWFCGACGIFALQPQPVAHPDPIGIRMGAFDPTLACGRASGSSSATRRPGSRSPHDGLSRYPESRHPLRSAPGVRTARGAAPISPSRPGAAARSSSPRGSSATR